MTALPLSKPDLTSAIDRLALGVIDLYRTHISHRKGFRCAAGEAGHPTCSTHIRNAVSERGALGAVRPALRQFGLCARSARDLRALAFRNPGGFGEGGYVQRQYRTYNARRRPSVQGVCCCGPIPIPFRF